MAQIAEPQLSFDMLQIQQPDLSAPDFELPAEDNTPKRIAAKDDAVAWPLLGGALFPRSDLFARIAKIEAR